MKIVILLLAALVAACNRRDQLCGAWGVEQRETLPESGSAHLALIRTSAGRSVKVDTFIFEPVCFDKDCVIYRTHRGGDDRIFVVCGDRRPVELNVAGVEVDDWHWGPEGLATDGEAVIAGGRICRKHRVFPENVLARRAYAQPRIESDWASKTLGVLTPLEECVAIAPKSVIASTMLTTAIARNDETIAISLIAAGVDVKRVDADGNSPIVLAAHAGFDVLVEKLLDAGADSSSRDFRGDDILMIAVNRHDVGLVKLLFERRGSLNVDPRSALNMARSLGQGDTMRILEEWARELR